MPFGAPEANETQWPRPGAAVRRQRGQAQQLKMLGLQPRPWMGGRLLLFGLLGVGIAHCGASLGLRTGIIGSVRHNCRPVGGDLSNAGELAGHRRYTRRPLFEADFAERPACPATPTASCSPSPPLAKATAQRLLPLSTADRQALSCPWKTCSATSTAASRAPAATPPSARKTTSSKSSPGCSRARPPAAPSAC